MSQFNPRLESFRKQFKFTEHFERLFTVGDATVQRLDQDTLNLRPQRYFLISNKVAYSRIFLLDSRERVIKEIGTPYGGDGRPNCSETVWDGLNGPPFGLEKPVDDVHYIVKFEPNLLGESWSMVVYKMPKNHTISSWVNWKREEADQVMKHQLDLIDRPKSHPSNDKPSPPSPPTGRTATGHL